MENPIYASEDGKRLAIFEGNTNHALVLNYVESLDMVDVRIMTGDLVEARFTINVHDAQLGRKYEELIGLADYFERIKGIAEENDKGVS